MKKKSEVFKKDWINYPLNKIPINLWDRVRHEARDVQNISMRVYILEALREKLARDEVDHGGR